LLIKRNEVIAKKIGTISSKFILNNSNSLKLYINGIKTKIPPAGEGTPIKKLLFQEL